MSKPKKEEIQEMHDTSSISDIEPTLLFESELHKDVYFLKKRLEETEQRLAILEILAGLNGNIDDCGEIDLDAHRNSEPGSAHY